MRNRALVRDGVKLVVFFVVTALATSLLVSPSATSPSVAARVQGRLRRRHRRRQGDDVRVAGVKVGSVKDVQGRRRDRPRAGHVHRRRGDRGHRPPPTWRSATATSSVSATIALTQEIGDADRLPVGTVIPVERTRPRPRPHRAVQRLQAAVPGAEPRRPQPAVGRDHPGLPGRGRHRGVAARAHRVGPRRWPTATS